jgi:hypothetical protein
MTPKAGEVVAAGKPYTITWTASSDTPIGRIDVSAAIINNNIGISQTICANLPGTATSCTWNNPGPITDNARVDVQAIDADGDEGFALSGRFSIQDPSGGNGSFPSGWQHGDIGNVGATGIATYNNGIFTLAGSGADIWGTADEFHYVYRTLNGAASGALDMTARVDSVQDVNAWTKAGLMFRSTLGAGSPHASIFITPGKGVVFQRRTAAGTTSINTSGPAISAPVWLRLTVNGGQVRAFYKKNATDAWTQLGVQLFADWIDGYGGLAVTSHADGTLATAAFSNVSVAPTPAGFGQTAFIGGATGTWSADDVGRTYTLTDKGADIWGTSDQFTFTYESWSGDGTATADVRSITNTNAWTKAGVMFRTSVAANSPHVSLFVTPGKGIAMQSRSTAGGTSTQVAQIAGTAPVFLRLTRSGNTFTGAWTTDASTWHTVAALTVAIDVNALAGLAVTSHDTAAIATATFVDPIVSR